MVEACLPSALPGRAMAPSPRERTAMRPRAADWRSRYREWFTTPQTVVVQDTTWCNLDCDYC